MNRMKFKDVPIGGVIATCMPNGIHFAYLEWRKISDTRVERLNTPGQIRDAKPDTSVYLCEKPNE